MNDPYDLLDQIDAFNQANDPGGALEVIAANPEHATALRAWHSERQMDRLRMEDLEAQGWITVDRAARYLPYSPVTIRLLARTDTLGPRHIAWERGSRWPFRMYISPDALSALHRRDYKASGPRQPYQIDRK